MKKTVRRSKKNQEKLYNLIFGGVLAVAVILLVTLIIARNVTPDATEYVITADGHVHTVDGAHVGDAAELFGSDYTVTADGHVHAADGTHIGTYDTTSAEATAEPTAEPTEAPAN